MSRVTKFAARDPGPSARIVGFIAHLRENGLRLGVAEADLAMSALVEIDAIQPGDSRRALRAVCTGCKEEAERFDDLFDSYWMDMGRVRQKVTPSLSNTVNDGVHSSRDATGEQAGSAGSATAPDGQEGAADSDGTGKLIASENRNLNRSDLRDLVRPEEIAEAEDVARQIGAALRDKRSRGHLRQTVRRWAQCRADPVGRI